MNAGHKPRAADRSMLDEQLRAIRRLGISELESADDVGERQADMLERLKSNGWFRHLRGPLRRCAAIRCGNDRCVEVCAFADWRRRLQQIPAAHRLIGQANDPVYEVHVVRGIWARPIDDLRTASIAAAKQLNRRALDSLYVPTLVAVGTFKVSLAPHVSGPPLGLRGPPGRRRREQGRAGKGVCCCRLGAGKVPERRAGNGDRGSGPNSQ